MIYDINTNYNHQLLKKYLLLNNSDYLSGHSFCDYCGKEYRNRDMHLEIEDESISNDIKSGLFGGMVVEKKWHYRTAKMCHRCKRIHKIIGGIHYFNGLVCIGFFLFAMWKSNDSYSLEKGFQAILLFGFLVFVLSRIDWFIVKLILGVRRKPKVDYWKYMNDR